MNETQTNSEADLTEPHFDETAIAVAQPVEPLPESTRRHKFADFYRHLSTRALLFVLAAALGLATVAFGFDGVVQRLGADEVQVEIKPTEAPTAAEPGDASTTTVEKNVTPRISIRKTRLRPIDSGSRPVARKVGEITYR